MSIRAIKNSAISQFPRRGFLDFAETACRYKLRQTVTEHDEGINK